MTQFFFNGEEVTEEELNKRIDESTNLITMGEKRIRERFGVSADTASAIYYLRTRSRWTLEKERELVRRDRVGDPIPLGKVLAGEF